MPLATITTATVWEDSDIVLMARVLGNDGNAIVQSNVSTINAKMFDLQSDETTDLLSDRSLTVSSVVFDTLQTADPRWAVDTTGYNFLYVLPSTDVTTPTVYQIEIKITPTADGPFHLVYQPTVQNLLGS